ncbi:CoA transferase [Spongiibacter nanhainus]|uniref:CoA transferase n=1 Tax=Spongiibacter nanhainus TaxID=2794344 RepID=A0A7T4UQI3_9GAMM|nr:CoA transferase [Spongiibacter nanhainus]QQD17345.1 CoA transferase [Spongiibacter nanhainus]
MAELLTTELPLQGLRVIDLADGKGEMCGRLLADLGADVILVEPPGGFASRQKAPLLGGESLHFASHHANKKSVCLDLQSAEGKAAFLALVDSADILIESRRPGEMAELGLDADTLRGRRADLIILSISDFGQTGPYRDYQASNAVQLAMGAVLARSGIAGNRPLLPPGELALETTAVQAAWVALLGYWQKLHTGTGNTMDFSILEATAQVIDPGLGVTGSAAAGRSANELAPYGRPPVGFLYPIFPCADGHVRICVLNPRQWQGMCGWLGDDHPFTDPKYGNIGVRFKEIKQINALIAALFADKAGEELVAEGQKRGVPIAAVATPEQVLNDSHFNARGAFVELPVAGRQGKLPSGYVEIDGQRMGLREPAPTLGQDNELLSGLLPRPAAQVTGSAKRRPLSGIRVLDLGVIVAGAESGRIFADQGAEVIKVENTAFADGLRQTSAEGVAISQSFCQGSRNKKSFGLNLRSPEGIAIFHQLAKDADVVLSNFKPGTLESLGIGYDDLKALNPGIIVVESSALGNTGPLAKSMGYGPLVRAASGLTGLWCYPELDNSYSDSITIVPDHFAARVSGVAILAALIRRERTGVGGRIAVSQAETLLNVLAAPLLRESLQPGSLKPLGNTIEFSSPGGVFPCAGDDMWCVIDVDSDPAWLALCEAMGRRDLAQDPHYANAEGRIAHREILEAAVADWTAKHDALAVMEQLQAAGVKAGKMHRLSDFDDNPHLNARNFFRHFEQPGFPTVLQTENGPVSFSDLPEPEIRPAPFQGQHTRELAATLLGFDAEKIEQLVADGVLEVMKENEFITA